MGLKDFVPGSGRLHGNASGRTSCCAADTRSAGLDTHDDKLADVRTQPRYLGRETVELAMEILRPRIAPGGLNRMLERPVIVIPAYQAALTLEGVFKRLPEALVPRLARIIVVDDGSRDQTWEVISRLAKEWPILRPLRHEVNRGYGGALKTLLEAALGKMPMASWCSMPTASTLRIAAGHAGALVLSEADLLQGSRLLGGGAPGGAAATRTSPTAPSPGSRTAPSGCGWPSTTAATWPTPAVFWRPCRGVSRAAPSTSTSR